MALCWTRPSEADTPLPLAPIGPAVIIAYGNPLREDDGLGWLAGQRLAEELANWPVEVHLCHQLTPDLALPLSQASRVAFIDAGAGAPGVITGQPVEPQAPQPSAFSHHLDPAGLLALAEALYGGCPPAALFTLGGEAFSYAEVVSAKARERVPALVALVKDWLLRPSGEAPALH
jgi:hydrogenase maturation protease